MSELQHQSKTIISDPQRAGAKNNAASIVSEELVLLFLDHGVCKPFIQ